MRRIPDLRADNQITKEHCYVLSERLGKSLDLMEGTISVFAGIAQEVDVELMQQFFEAQFEPRAFARLFTTETGKHLLIGMYLQALCDQITAEDLEGLDEV